MTASTLPAATPPSRTATGRTRPIGALWRRILAFFLDLILVGILESILALFLGETFIRIGNWSLLVSFALALPYYALLNSVFGGGQTIGKRVLSLEVVDARGQSISFEMSLIRYIVFAVPIIFSYVTLPARMPLLLSDCISFAIGGLSLATLYLICFSRKTRQGVHDLVADTYVVEAGSPGPIIHPDTWKPHWAILAALLGLIFIGDSLHVRAEFMSELRQDNALIEQEPDVMSAGVVENVQLHANAPATIDSFTALVRWTGTPGGEQQAADVIADLLRQQDPRIDQSRGLTVVIRRGFSLGFVYRMVDTPFSYPSRPSQAPDNSSSAPNTGTDQP